MFGADTPLVMDALQIAALAAVGAAGAVYLMMRRMKRAGGAAQIEDDSAMDLSKRVEVLERIATDQSIGLADEIEALRDGSARAEKLESTAP